MKKNTLAHLIACVLITLCCSLRATIFTYVYSDSHRPLVDRFFLPSLKQIEPDLTIIAKHIAQECPSGTYYSSGWQLTTRRKIEFVLEMTREHPGEVIIFSDVDIIFHRPIAAYLKAALADKDLVIQDSPNTVCTGFFAFRANEKTEQLWIESLKAMDENRRRDDQKAVDHVLKTKQLELTWELLPRNEFYMYGWIADKPNSGGLWVPGRKFKIPPELILFHANYTKGLYNKKVMLRYVESVLQKRLEKSTAL